MSSARPRLDDVAWSSAWRARPAWVKTTLALGLLAAAVVARSPWVSLVAGVIAAGLALGPARVPWRSYLVAASAPLVFVVLSAITSAITFDTSASEIVATFGPVAFTEDAITRGLTAATRSIGGIAAVLLLAMTTPMTDLLTLARRCRVPGSIVDIAAVMYRMTFGLLRAASEIQEAQRSRLGYRTAKVARRSFGLMSASLLERAWSNAQRLDDGLALRAPHGSLATISPRVQASKLFAAAAITVVVVALLAAIVVPGALTPWGGVLA